MAEPTPTSEAPATTKDNDKLQSLELPPEERLRDLIAQATALYSVKDYSPAAELYSQATELQDEVNGEMNPDNADLLYSYGKCLYFVAVRNSEVLGAASAGAELSKKKTKRSESKPSAKKRKLNGDAGAVNGRAEANGTVAKVGSNTQASALPQLEEALKKEKEEPSADNKAYFNITGDENWDDSEEEGAEADNQDEGAEADEEEDQDDFSLAYEILDVARILLLRKMENLSAALPTPPEPTPSPGYLVNPLNPFLVSLRLIKTRLADVHDLQAEINLENELYPAAITDLRSSLELTEQIYPFESNLLAECHYKLSLALEFASATQARDAAGNPTGTATIDKAMRAEALAEMEKAIDSCESRMKMEQAAADALEPGVKRDAAVKDIADVREIVEEMQLRREDLKRDPIDAVAEASRQPELEAAGGLLGEILSKAGGVGGLGPKEDVKRMLEEAAAGAREITGLVRKKKAQPSAGDDSEAGSSGYGTPEPMANGTNTTKENRGSALGKRKVTFADDDHGDNADDVDNGSGKGPTDNGSKRAKVEEVEDSGK